MYYVIQRAIFKYSKKMPKSKKLQVQPAQAPNKVAPKNGLKQPKPTHLISIPVPRSHHLLAVIRRIPYFPLLGPLKTKPMKTAYIQMHLFHLFTLGWHKLLCGKGKAIATDQNIDSQLLLQEFKKENSKADPL
jgi:hypothetical protein